MRVLPLFLCAVAVPLGGATPVPEAAIELPPFVINTVVIPDHRWKYATIPGFEILSECSDFATREVVAALWRGRQMALPPELRPRFEAPMTVILFDRPPSGGAPGSLGLVQKPGEMKRHWTNLIKRTSSDRESFAINLWGVDFKYSAGFRFDMMTLLRRRAPAAPLWLSEGLFGFYGVYREGMGLDLKERFMDVKPSVWCSVAEFGAIMELASPPGDLARVGESKVAGFLPPLQAILEEPPPADEAGIARWLSTAALFVRWGIYSDPQRTQDFWLFARRSCSEPVTEELFRQCFGKTYREVRAELSWYLKPALTKYASIPVEITPLPAFELNQAKLSQAARVLGEWLRIEAEALDAKFPDVAQKYREQALEKLQRDYDRGGIRDPRLLATLGLLTLRSGNPQAATNLLEAAVAGKVAGPKVYLELATLRLAAARDRGQDSPQDYAAIAQLLLQAERQGPPMRAVYLMLAEVLPQLEAPDTEQRAALQRGVDYFPRDPAVRAAIRTAQAPTPLPNK